MSDSGGDGSQGTGIGGFDVPDQPTGAEQSHHREHHREDSDRSNHLVVDLNTGVATFSAVRRTPDEVNSAKSQDDL